MKGLELQVSAIQDEITRLKRQTKELIICNNCLVDRIDQLESDIMFITK